MTTDVFHVGNLRVRRYTLLGKEGGLPPVMLLFENSVGGGLLGLYYCDERFHRLALGPMFA